MERDHLQIFPFVFYSVGFIPFSMELLATLFGFDTAIGPPGINR
jgi:hypothetical protein